MVAVDKETSATVVHPWFGWLRGVAGVVALVIAGLYGLLFFEVLVVAGTEDAGRGILGVAAVVFAVLAVLMWSVRSRVVWIVAALLQVLMAGMYLVVSTDRDPPFEVWGLTARGLSLVLLASLVAMLVMDRRNRAGQR
jgi:hypothetical protein